MKGWLRQLLLVEGATLAPIVALRLLDPVIGFLEWVIVSVIKILLP